MGVVRSPWASTGVLQTGDYPRFRALYETVRVQEAACSAYVRCKFHGIARANGSQYAREALTRIGSLYAVEVDLRGQPSDRRRRERQARAGPVLEDLHT